MNPDDPQTMIAWLEREVAYYLAQARAEINTGGFPGPEPSVRTARFFNRMLLHLRRGIRAQE